MRKNPHEKSLKSLSSRLKYLLSKFSLLSAITSEKSSPLDYSFMEQMLLISISSSFFFLPSAFVFSMLLIEIFYCFFSTYLKGVRSFSSIDKNGLFYFCSSFNKSASLRPFTSSEPLFCLHLTILLKLTLFHNPLADKLLF